MFERFTETAREVVTLAQEEARLMRHARVGTEHLLVGLARSGDPDASAVLLRYGLTGERTRGEVVRVMGMGDSAEHGQIPFTPAAHDALDAALHEAMLLGHERVEPAHLLLGMLRQQDALARRLLVSAGATPADVRSEVVRQFGEHTAPVRRDEPAPDPLPVRLGEALLGDIGHPQVDGHLLLEILERRGAVAAWLRERGVDEHAVRRMLGDDA